MRKKVIFLGQLANQMTTYCIYRELKKYSDVEGIFLHRNELNEIFKVNINEKKVKRPDWYAVKFQKIKWFLNFFKILYRDSRNTNEDFLTVLKDWKIKYFCGCWYETEYIKENKEDLIREFQFPKIIDKNNLEIAKKIQETESVSIHVRRGDYQSSSLFGNVCTLEYYNEAIKYIKTKIKDPVFYIFSNDIEWCKKNLKIEEEHYYITWNNKKENNFRDMQLMTLCKHNIIANSSFSWWGALLNRNSDQVVIYPEKWVNLKYSFIKKIRKILNRESNTYINMGLENWYKIKN